MNDIDPKKVAADRMRQSLRRLGLVLAELNTAKHTELAARANTHLKTASEAAMDLLHCRTWSAQEMLRRSFREAAHHVCEFLIDAIMEDE